YELVPFDGPLVTIGLAAATGLLATAAAFLAATRGVMTRARLLRFAILAAIIALALISTFTAANRFHALIGTADLALSLVAGWVVSLLCQNALLGDRGRRIVFAALAALLAVWAFKGIYQRAVEYPETIAEYQAHKAENLRQSGIPLTDELQIRL